MITISHLCKIKIPSLPPPGPDADERFICYDDLPARQDRGCGSEDGRRFAADAQIFGPPKSRHPDAYRQWVHELDELYVREIRRLFQQDGHGVRQRRRHGRRGYAVYKVKRLSCSGSMSHAGIMEGCEGGEGGGVARGGGGGEEGSVRRGIRMIHGAAA